MPDGHDVEHDTAEISSEYECLQCGKIVEAETHPGECPECGDTFWTRDEGRATCGEPPCAEYAFIGDPGFDAERSLEKMREEMLAFFDQRGHDRVEPYPVAANRWREP